MLMVAGRGDVLLPVDVAVSNWDTGFEPGAPATVAGSRGELRHPVRLGLSRISGLSSDAGERIVNSRQEAAFKTIEDLTRRAALNAHELQALAAADALLGLSGHRHQAAWTVAGIDTRPTALLRQSRVHEQAVEMAAPSEGEDMVADYRALGLTLKRHPLALLREQLNAYKVLPAAVLRTRPDGSIARASGLVTHRQRPQTAKGTVFVTLEDDTGAINVIVWPSVVESQRRALVSSRLMTVYGRWQCEGEVMHLVASRIVDHSEMLQGLVTYSRDFR